MPPVGGFESIKYKRNLPFRGPGAYVILGGVTAICAYGFYRLGKGNLERRLVLIIASELGDLLPRSAERGTCHHVSRSTLNVVAAFFGSGRFSPAPLSY